MDPKQNDGGPAFPATRYEDICVGTGPHGDSIIDKVPVTYRGMSLRAWFAGQYLASHGWRSGMLEDYAAEAVQAADALISALQSAAKPDGR